MANSLKADLGPLRALWESGTLLGLDDRELLARFVEDGSGLAFEGLVRRHGPMVFRVCSQLLDDRHAAEDAFQAVFLVLARRARSIRHPEQLAPWLHGVALRTSKESRVREIKRDRLERRGASMPPSESGPPEHALIRAEEAEALHGEIARLPERYRGPVVLCDLEGLTQQEAATRLRCPVGTVAIRLKRARERLRDRLTRRKIGPAAGSLLANAGPAGNFPIPSPGLIEATVRAATTAGSASASALFLAQGVQTTMTIARWKTATGGAALALGLAATWGVAGGLRPGQDEKPAPAARPWKVEKAVVREVRDFEEYSGVTKASRTQEVRPRVAGRLEKALVEVGANVKANEVLFEIDPGPYLAPLKEAQARVARAAAQKELARMVTARNARLRQKDPTFVSDQDVEKAEAELALATQSVADAREGEAQARGDLDATRVRAPFDGIIAACNAVVGNEVDRGVTSLASIAVLDPIAVEFQVDERTLLKIRRAYGDDRKALEALPIRLALPMQSDFDREARLESIADRLEPATATAQFRATAPNPDRSVKAQMLVRVRVTTGPPRQALVVPDSAIWKGPKGTMVYAVDQDDVIRERVVQPGRSHGDVREVREGLEPGDRVLAGDLKGVKPGTTYKP